MVPCTWCGRKTPPSVTRIATPGGWHLDPYPVPGESPALAVDRDGVPHLVYVDPEGDIQHTRRGSKGWGAPSNISSTSGQSNHPDIALTSDHGIHVVWSEKMGEDYLLYHAKSLDNGASWAAMQPIPNASGYAPSLAWATTGRLMVAWQNKAAETDVATRIHSAEYDGDLWTHPITVPLGLEGDARDPDLGIDPAGRAHLVWEEESQTGISSIYYAQNATGTWTTPVTLSSGSDEARYPSIAIGPTADINTAWSIGHSLLHRHFEPGRLGRPRTGDHRAGGHTPSNVGRRLWWRCLCGIQRAEPRPACGACFLASASPYEVPTPTMPPATLTPSAPPPPPSAP